MKDIEIGYQMSLEQFQPDVALGHAMLAEDAGFESIWASDHFMPWFHTNAATGFAWSWLGSAAQATKKIRFGTGLTCPILRYHPALVAQAFATLDHMYKDRIFLSLGTGEALNEMPLGYNWPSYNQRIRKLAESIEIIRRLWSGELLSYKSNHYTVRKAKLYTLPKGKIPIFVAAAGPTAAEFAGRAGDGLLTVAAPDDAFFKNVLFPAVERGLKASQKDTVSFQKNVEVQVSYDEDYESAIRSARPWAGSLMPVFYKYAIPDPKEIENHGNLVGNEQLAETWVIATSSEPIIKCIERYTNLGFTGIHITSSSPSQEKFIDLFKKQVLPSMK